MDPNGKDNELSAVVRLITRLPGAVVLFSADEFRIKYMSDAYRAYLPGSLKDKDLVGVRFVDYVADGESNPSVSRVLHSKSGEGKEIKNYHIKNGDGVEFWVDWIGSPVDNGTEKWDVLLQIRDNTEQKRTEQTAEEERARLQAVLESAPIGIFIGDKNGKTVLLNDMVHKYLGMNAPSPAGPEEYRQYKGWYAETGEELKAQDWPGLRAREGEASSAVVDIRRFDGGKGTIIISAVPLRRSRGRGVGLHHGVSGHHKAKADGGGARTGQRGVGAKSAGSHQGAERERVEVSSAPRHHAPGNSLPELRRHGHLNESSSRAHPGKITRGVHRQQFGRSGALYHP